MKCYKIPVKEDEFFFTMPAPLEPDQEFCNRNALQLLNVSLVVSLLSIQDIEDLELAHEEKVIQDVGINFIHFPINDFAVPQDEQAFVQLAKDLSLRIERKEIIAIHCRAGIGRSSLLAAAILIHLGFEPTEVFDYISEYRQTTVPDKRSQAEWLLSLVPQLTHKM